MSKDKMKKLTLADIISKKEQILEGKKKIGKIFIPSLEGYITIEKPDKELIADAQEYENPIESDIHLVTNCIVEPNLKDKQAMEEFGVYTPKEFLQAIMEDGEISATAVQIMTLAGFMNSGVALVEDLKN